MSDTVANAARLWCAVVPTFLISDCALFVVCAGVISDTTRRYLVSQRAVLPTSCCYLITTALSPLYNYLFIFKWVCQSQPLLCRLHSAFLLVDLRLLDIRSKLILRLTAACRGDLRHCGGSYVLTSTLSITSWLLTPRCDLTCRPYMVCAVLRLQARPPHGRCCLGPHVLHSYQRLVTNAISDVS